MDGQALPRLILSVTWSTGAAYLGARFFRAGPLAKNRSHAGEPLLPWARRSRQEVRRTQPVSEDASLQPFDDIGMPWCSIACGGNCNGKQEKRSVAKNAYHAAAYIALRASSLVSPAAVRISETVASTELAALGACWPMPASARIYCWRASLSSGERSRVVRHDGTADRTYDNHARVRDGADRTCADFLAQLRLINTRSPEDRICSSVVTPLSAPPIPR